MWPGTANVGLCFAGKMPERSPICKADWKRSALAEGPPWCGPPRTEGTTLRGLRWRFTVSCAVGTSWSRAHDCCWLPYTGRKAALTSLCLSYKPVTFLFLFQGPLLPTPPTESDLAFQPCFSCGKEPWKRGEVDTRASTLSSDTVFSNPTFAVFPVSLQVAAGPHGHQRRLFGLPA